MIQIGRRNFLTLTAGLGLGAAVLRPILAGSVAEAAPATTPKRLVIIGTANGLTFSLRRDSTLGADSGMAADIPHPGLRPIFEGLRPYKEELLIVDGLYNPYNATLHGSGFAATSLVQPPFLQEEHPAGVSFDRFMAGKLGQGVAFDSINLACIPHHVDSMSRSADGLQRVFPAEASPSRAYQSIFGKLASGGLSERDLERESNLFKFLQDDAKRLKGRLGALENQKLDQIVESMAALDARVRTYTATSAQCSSLASVTEEYKDSYMSISDALIEAQLAIVANAITCGQTRVASLNFGSSDGEISHYGFSALKHRDSHHKYCHDSQLLAEGKPPEIDGDTNPEAAQTEIHSYIFGKIGKLWGMLKQAPEGNGSVADNTILMVINDGGGEHHNGSGFLPLVLLGSAGRLKSGRYVALSAPDRKGTTSTADVFVTVANALGVDIASFGTAETCKGPIALLEA